MNFLLNQDTITLDFKHKEAGSFAGIGYNLAEFPDYFDITSFSHIRLNLTTANIPDCTVTIKLFIDGITNVNDSSSYRHLSINFPVVAGRAEYNLPLKTFQDPAWWILNYNPQRKPLGKEHLKHACYLLIESSTGDRPPVSFSASRLTVNYIKFQKSYLPPIMLAALIIVGYYTLLLGLAFFLRQRRLRLVAAEPVKTITQKPLLVGNYRDQDLEKITVYLQDNYHDPSLSLVTLSRATGVSTNRISSLIKTAYKTSFKQLLNRLRLLEATRLLEQTDRQIIEIAFAVGYNDRSYFYKVFRKYKGLSPREYRKQQH